MPQQDSSNRLYDFSEDDNQDRLPIAPLPATGGGTSVAIRQVPHDVGTTLASQSQINLQPTVEQAKYNLTPVDSNPFTEAMDYPVQAATDFAKFLKRNLIDAPVQAITEEGRILHATSRPVDPSTLTYPPQPKSLNQIYQEAGPFGKMAITGAAEPYLLPKNLIYEPIKAAKDLTQQMAEGTFNPTSKEDVSRSLLAAGLGGTGGLVGVPEGSAISGLGFKQLLDKQRELEGMRAAIRDPDTRKIYAGKIGENLDHSDIINNITDPIVKQKFMDDLNSENPDFKKFGFLDHRGKFVSRDTLDQQYGVSDTGQLKSKLNMFRSDTGEASQAENALQKLTTPTFYSAVENAVNNIKQTKAPAEQWLSTIQNSKGVKSEEMDWIGLKDYLNENKGKSITKQEIQDYVNANKVQLQEVNKAQYGLSNEGDPNVGTAKYSQYQLPGGKNYREKLLTLPFKDANARLQRYKDIFNRIDEINNRLEKIYNENTIEAGKERINLENERNTLKREYNLLPYQGEEFKSSHWDEPNVIAHVRMNDRDIEGEKALHIEEIQADWLQQGRKYGFKQNEPLTTRPMESNQFGSGVHEAVNNQGIVVGRGNSPEEALEAAKRMPSVSNAPFKKTWHELVLKRMIREAAEKGYDRLSWTPGEAQAERYDLSKHIDSVEYNPSTQQLFAHKDNHLLIHETASSDKIANYIGKEAADKLLNNPTYKIESKNNPGTYNHYLKGLDLKVGGEGMKGFYDQIIPKALEKISGQKVKYANLSPSITTRILNGEHIVYNNGKEVGRFNNFKSAQELINELKEGNNATLKSQKVPYIDIPQSLKDIAMQKGFPLFSSSGAMLVPVDHNPHDQIKPLNSNLSRSEAARIK